MNQKSRTPYTLVGAEELTAAVYKTGDELIGFDYRFNVARLNNRTGRVNQWFRPEDLVAFVKLLQVLATELADDGCIDRNIRRQLIGLAASLDCTLAEISSNVDLHGERD